MVKIFHTIVFTAFFLSTLSLHAKPPSSRYSVCQGVAESVANNRADDSKTLTLPNEMAGPVQEYLLPFYEVDKKNDDSKDFQHGPALASAIDKNSEWALDILLDMIQKFPELIRHPEKHHRVNPGSTLNICPKLGGYIDNTAFFAIILEKSFNHIEAECKNNPSGQALNNYLQIADLIVQASSPLKLTSEKSENSSGL